MQLLAAAKAVSLTCSALMATSGLVLTLTCPIPASAWTHGTTKAAPCSTYTAYLSTDGCLGAPAGGAFQIPNGGTFQSIPYTNGLGQWATQTTTYDPSVPNTGTPHVSLLTAGHPQPFNIPGWDYPVGTYGTLTAASVAVLPSGCTYSSSPHPNVDCHNLTADTTIQGVDFTNVTLSVDGTITSGITVALANDLFSRGSANPLAAQIALGAGTYNVVFQSDTLYGNAAINNNNPSSLGAEIIDSRVSSGTTTWQYTYAYDLAGRLMNSNTYGSLTAKWNAVWDWGVNAAAGQIHNEIFGWFPVPTSPVTVPLIDIENNTSVEDTSIQAGYGTTPWFFSEGNSLSAHAGVTVTTLTLKQNTNINNVAQTCAPGFCSGNTWNTAYGLSAQELTAVGTETIQQNYNDSNGSPFCAANLDPGNGLKGFIDDGLGGGSYDGVNGNILTVTTPDGLAPIAAGAHVWRYGTPIPGDPVIASYGTGGTSGTGGTGTYTVWPGGNSSGGTITATNGGSTTWMTTTAIGTLNMPQSGSLANIDLYSGQAIVNGGPSWTTLTTYSEATYGSTYPGVCQSALGQH